MPKKNRQRKEIQEYDARSASYSKVVYSNNNHCASAAVSISLPSWYMPGRKQDAGYIVDISLLCPSFGVSCISMLSATKDGGMDIDSIAAFVAHSDMDFTKFTGTVK